MGAKNCAPQMRSWIERGTDPYHTLQVSSPKTPTDQVIAAFLIARGESAVFNFQTLGIYGEALQYGWNPYMDKDYGEPLEQASESPAGVFLRRWSKATIVLDCNTFAAFFATLESPLPSRTI